MEYSFIIEILPDHKSVLGIEFMIAETAIEIDGHHEDRTAYSFIIGLALIHLQFIIYRKIT